MQKEFNCLDVEESLSGYYVLEASAGTGKTFAIEQLYARLLLENNFETSIDKVLVVTFTKAAAKELKERIHLNLKKVVKVLEGKEEIGEYSYLLPFLTSEEKRQKTLQKLKETLFVFFEEAQIFTIHGFCFRMLYEFAFDAKTLFSESSNETETMKKFVIRSVLNELIEKKLLTAGQILLLTSSFGSEKKLFQKAFSGIFQETQLYSATEIQSNLNDLLKFHEISIVKLLQEILDLPKYFLKKTDLLEMPILSLKMGNLQKILDRKWVDFSELDELIFFWGPLLEYLNDENRKKAKANFSFFEIEKLKRLFLPLLKQGFNRSAVFSYFRKQLIVRWEDLLKEEGYFSFELILKEMLKALEVNEFVERVQNKYQAVMIDEFQDTDSDQWAIFDQLFVQHKKCSSFFIIGDPKQSIYRFRKADLYSFLKAKEAFGQEGHRILRTNFRSSPSLVNALNHLFDHEKGWLSLPRLNQKLAYIPVSAKKGLREKILSDEIQSLHFFLCQKENAEEILYQRIANEMIDLHEKQNIGLHQMAVLVKDRYQAEKIEDFLLRKKIPFTNYTFTSFGEKIFTQGLRDFFEAILDPFNPSKASRVWFGPFFKEDAKLDIEMFSKFLIEFRKFWSQKKLAGILEALKKIEWNEKTLFARWIEDAKMQQEIEDVLELLSIYFQNVPIDETHLFLFFEWLQEKEYKKNPDSKNDRDTGVKILTIHMSKGLEFDIVFPIGVTLPVSVESDQSEEEKKETEAEKLRQFYVALTRAKERVYVPIIFSSNYKSTYKESSLVELFFNTFLADPFLLDHYLPHFQKWASEKIMSFEIVETEGFFKIFNARFQRRKAFNLTKESFQIANSNEKILSFSSLKYPIDEKTNLKEVSDGAFPYSKEKLSPSQKTGKIFHETFEEIFRKNLFKGPSKAYAEIIKRKVRKYGFYEEHEKLIQEMIFSYLSLPLTPFDFSLKDLSYAHLFPECEFLFSQSEFWVKGYIDLFFIHEGSYFILDWKSNWLGDGKEFYEGEFLEKEMQQKRYHLQASLYYDALNRLGQFDKQNIKRKKFGGVFYIFIRGLDSKNRGIYHFYPKIENLECMFSKEKLPSLVSHDFL